MSRSCGTTAVYVLALLWALAGLVVTALSTHALAGPLFMFQFAAVVGAALQGGLGPGLLTTALSAVGFYAAFYAPGLEAYQAYRLASFAGVSVFFAWLAARLRQTKAAETAARVRLEAEKVAADAARADAERAMAEAKAIGALQERLVAVVSHDLRNPLHAITMTAEQLSRLEHLSERQARGLARIAASAERMQSLVNGLLDFARARHGAGVSVQLRAARLGDICRAVLEEARTAHPERTILLGVADDDLAAVDPARVEQVISNLVTNALKYGAAGTPVEVEIADDGGAGVRLAVTSHGPPIAPQLMSTLFEPFCAGDAPGSVGLGLFIVREIARAHGGRASVRSDERGTTFTVLFPWRAAELAAAAAG